MRKLILFILISLLMGVFAFKEPITAFSEKIIYHSPCETPKTYRIGSIDPKYNMTEDEFIARIDDADDIWSNTYGKNLFVYDPEGDIEVNLVYDQRQFLSTQISDLNSKVKDQQKALDPEIANYKNRSADFRSKVSKLNSDIEYWNERGGATPEEYESLKSRQTALKQEAEVLQSEAARLNQSTDEYNSQVGQLHKTVDSFNQELAFKPEEGEYVYDNGKQTINIYFGTSQTELVHTLAHELGHALGISHNNNEMAIMYPQTTDTTILSIEDRAGLGKACEKRNVVLTGVERLSIVVDQLRLRFIN